MLRTLARLVAGGGVSLVVFLLREAPLELYGAWLIANVGPRLDHAPEAIVAFVAGHGIVVTVLAVAAFALWGIATTWKLFAAVPFAALGWLCGDSLVEWAQGGPAWSALLVCAVTGASSAVIGLSTWRGNRSWLERAVKSEAQWAQLAPYRSGFEVLAHVPADRRFPRD